MEMIWCDRYKFEIIMGIFYCKLCVLIYWVLKVYFLRDLKVFFSNLILFFVVFVFLVCRLILGCVIVVLVLVMVCVSKIFLSKKFVMKIKFFLIGIFYFFKV